VAKQKPPRNRNRVDAKVVAAHERVLERWPDGRIEELSDIVRDEPAYRPLKPTAVEAAFYFERKREMEDVEVEPVVGTFGGGAQRVVDWEVVG